MGQAEPDRLTALHLDRGWTDADLAGGLGPAELIGLEALEMSAGVHWSLGDLLVVGLCGGLGALAAAVDPQVDEPGTDRPVDDGVVPVFELLGAIRAGRYDGVTWTGAVRDLTAHFGFHPVTGHTDALALWLHRLVVDVVQPLGLPDPAWTGLFRLPVQEIRQFAHETFAEARLRSAAAPTAAVAASLPVVIVETVVRAHVHWQALTHWGVPRPMPDAQERLDDMLRAAHAMVAATALTPAALAGFGDGTGRGEADVRALIRSGLTAVEVVRARRARFDGGAARWFDDVDLPWSSTDAPTVAARLDRLPR